MSMLVAIMAARLKPLPWRHRIAHLRALKNREPEPSIRREQLMLLLRRETTAQPDTARAEPAIDDSQLFTGATGYGTGQAQQVAQTDKSS
jgi:hypothetical protein